MSRVTISCPVKDCKFFGKTMCVEFSYYIRHLDQNHDHADLVRLAFDLGIIQSPYGFHSHNYIIHQIAQISKVRQA